MAFEDSLASNGSDNLRNIAMDPELSVFEDLMGGGGTMTSPPRM